MTRQVEAVPTFRVTHHYADAETARKATQAKEIYGYLVIPNRFEEDVTGGRQATLSYYYHYALLSVGGEVRGAFESLLRTFSMAPIVVQATAMGISQKEVSTFLVPIRAQNHQSGPGLFRLSEQSVLLYLLSGVDFAYDGLCGGK